MLFRSSGSGKTTILNTVFDQVPLKIDNELTVIENFSSPERGEELLLACGLRTIPAWFRSPKTLSNGEYHRFEIAVGLDQGNRVIDEFTSVVDRDTAKSLALSVRKYFDKNPGVLYIASCHRDIIDWLDPEWVYDTDLQVLDNRRSLFRLGTRPELTLTIKSTSAEIGRAHV